MGKGSDHGVVHYTPVSSDPVSPEPIPTSPMAANNTDELERGLLPTTPVAVPQGYFETARDAVNSALTAVKAKFQDHMSSPPQKEGYEAPPCRMRRLMACQGVKMLLAALVGALLVIAAAHIFHGPPPPRPWGPWGMEAKAAAPPGVLGWFKGLFFGQHVPPHPPSEWDFLLDSDLSTPPLDCPPHGPPHGRPQGRPHGPPHGGCHPHGHPHGPPHGPPHRPPHGPPHGPPFPFGPHGPFPPPPPFARMLIENTTRLVAEAVEEFFGAKLAVTEGCNASLSEGVAAIVKSATDKVTAFAEEPTACKIREAFANFTKAYPRLAGLSAIADAHVMPLKLAYLRSLTSGACYNDSTKTMPKLFAIEGAVDRFFLPAVFRALLPPPPFGPHGPPHRGPHPHGPPRGDDDDDDVSCDDDVSLDDVAPKGADSWIDPRWLESGARAENKCPHRKPDPETLKKCVATNLELSRAVVKKAAFMLCNGPKPPHIRQIVAEVCEFAEENKELVRTTVLLRLQPWKIAIGACLPPPPPPHHGPHRPPHGDGPEGPPFKPPHGGPPHDNAENEEETKVYAFPDVFEGFNVGEETAP